MKTTAMLSRPYPLTVNQHTALKGQGMNTCTVFGFPKQSCTSAGKAYIQSITPHFQKVIFSVHLFTNKCSRLKPNVFPKYKVAMGLCFPGNEYGKRSLA